MQQRTLFLLFTLGVRWLDVLAFSHDHEMRLRSIRFIVHIIHARLLIVDGAEYVSTKGALTSSVLLGRHMS